MLTELVPCMGSSFIIKCVNSIVLSFVFLFLGGLLYENYREYAYAKAAKSHNCKVPLTYLNRPFGLKTFYGLTKAHRRNRFLGHVRKCIETSPKLTYRTQNLFTVNILTRDPENVKTILATDFKSYDTGYRHDQLVPYLGDGIFTSNGAFWKHSRSILRPMFTRENISRLHMYEEHVLALIRILKEGSDKISDDDILNSFKGENHDGLLDVQNLFIKFTMDTSSQFLLDQSLETLSPDDKVLKTSKSSIKSSDLINALDIAGRTVSQRTRAGSFYYIFDNKEFRSNVKIVHEFVNDIIEDKLAGVKRRNGEDEEKSFLEELSMGTRDINELRSQALNLLLAGRSTTAGLLSFVIYYLVRDKRVWNKLRQTVIETFGEDPENVTYESLKRCSYLQYVFNETLRLCPIVPINGRRAIKDTVLPRGNGEFDDEPIFVPKGTFVIYPVFLMHRLEQYWGNDAEEFRPERWYENSYHTWDYLPFNGGPRICLGQQFSLAEASYVMVRLLQTFRDVTTTQEVLDRKFLQRTNIASNVYGGVWVKFVE